MFRTWPCYLADTAAERSQLWQVFEAEVIQTVNNGEANDLSRHELPDARAGIWHSRKPRTRGVDTTQGSVGGSNVGVIRIPVWAGHCIAGKNHARVPASSCAVRRTAGHCGGRKIE